MFIIYLLSIIIYHLLLFYSDYIANQTSTELKLSWVWVWHLFDSDFIAYHIHLDWSWADSGFGNYYYSLFESDYSQPDFSWIEAEGATVQSCLLANWKTILKTKYTSKIWHTARNITHCQNSKHKLFCDKLTAVDNYCQAKNPACAEHYYLFYTVHPAGKVSLTHPRLLKFGIQLDSYPINKYLKSIFLWQLDSPYSWSACKL